MDTHDIQTIALTRRLAADGTARRIRQRARLSLHDLATEVGVADSTLCRWETGKRAPRGALAARWGDALAGLVDLIEEGP